MNTSSSDGSSSSSRCVREALFLPDDALSRLSLLVAGRKGSSSNASELALVVQLGELAKRLDAALSLMRVWWDASLENDASSFYLSYRERGDERGATEAADAGQNQLLLE